MRFTVLERAYIHLLSLPHDVVRAQNQKLYADIRDMVAIDRGWDDERTQDYFETYTFYSGEQWKETILKAQSSLPKPE